MGAVDELKLFDGRLASDTISPEYAWVKNSSGQALRCWQAGLISKKEALTLAQTETRQYAKRQMTWFNNQIKKASNINSIKIIS